MCGVCSVCVCVVFVYVCEGVRCVWVCGVCVWVCVCVCGVCLCGVCVCVCGCVCLILLTVDGPNIRFMHLSQELTIRSSVADHY